MSCASRSAMPGRPRRTSGVLGMCSAVVERTVERAVTRCFTRGLPWCVERLNVGQGRCRYFRGNVGSSRRGSVDLRRRRDYMRRPHVIAALAVTVALSAALVAGAQARISVSAGKAPAASKAPSGTVTLNGWQSSPQEEARLAKVVKDFEAKYPKIHVNYQSFNNYQATMLAKFASRKPPDVFYVDVADFADWVRQGVLQQLDSYVKSSKFNTKPFYKNFLNAFKYKGKTYGFPKDWSSLGMEVNRSLMGGQPIPKTWAQLKSVASKITIPGGKPICLSADWARLM